MDRISEHKALVVGWGTEQKERKKGENAEEDHISEASFGLYTEFYFSLF